MSIKGRYSIPLIVVIAVGLSIIIFFNSSDRTSEEPETLHKSIASDDVKKTRMGVWVFSEPRFENVDVDLSEAEVNQVRSLFNSVSADGIREVQQVNPALSAGIVFNLKSSAEVRIQYDKEDVYVTRTDKTGQKKYIVESAVLKEFFDNKLKLFHVS